MIKKEFLDIMESQHYCICGILHEILQIKTYRDFFQSNGINIKYTDFRPLGEKGRSTKVLEFIEKNKNSMSIVGPIHFIEYLINHNSDNMLKLIIKEHVPVNSENSSPLDVFKLRFLDFKSTFLNEQSIPFVTNLTANTMTDKSYIPIQGRDKELREIERQLGKLMKNNVVLTGNGGVGKTAIVEEFALRKKDSYIIFELNVLGLISKGKEASSILESILDNLSSLSGTKVLFIDEFHILVKEGLADSIKRLISRSADLKFIVATTHDEFRLFIEKDKALERRFYPVPIEEIHGETLKNVLIDWANKLSETFGIKYESNIIDFIIDKMSIERQKTSPDKEKDIIDAAFSGCRLDNIAMVDKEVVADVMASRLSIPKKQLLSTMFDVIQNLEDNLKKEIKGQDLAIKNIVRVIESSQMRKKKNKPIAVMFFTGETSVGKTEVARQLAKHMFGSEKNLIQIDCTNFKEQHTVSSLLGSPPGYVGSESGGKLINDVKQKPFSVILFDEFEKAHKDLQDIMLPIFEEGIITDRLGREVSVSNCIIILTSNLGAKESNLKKTNNASTLGFDKPIKSEEDYDDIQNDLTDKYKSYLRSMKNSLKPELIARINEIVVFSKLTDSSIREIIIKKLNEMTEFYLTEYNMKISYVNDIVDFIEKKSMKNPRKISVAIEKYLQSIITKNYITQQIHEGDSFELCVINNTVGIGFGDED